MRLECECSTEFLPHSLRAHGQQLISRLWDSLNSKDQVALNAALKQTEGLDKQLITALLGSDYIVESCCRDSSLLFSWLLSDVPFAPLTPVKIIDAVNTTCSDEFSPEEFSRVLRNLRRRFMVGIYWRDLNRLADFNETSKAVTALAEVCIQQALDFNFKDCVKKYGMPIGKGSGLAQPMLVIGMGKLGGGELNVSSDIDLLFAFDEAGETDHPKKPIDNQQFFNRLGQQLIKTLGEVTADGFVFRVDMRLRPYGQSGALCSNFLSLENYYQSQGRDWERFAAIKARVVACSNLQDPTLAFEREKAISEKFYALLKPFVYRKYVDFSMIDSLRQLKALILQEVHRKSMHDDIKLGAGGIREVEFIAQAFQLVRGGRDTRLQTRNLIATLELLAEQGVLSYDSVEGLTRAYIFLRNVEHGIQASQDEQTQRLPQDELALMVLAFLLGFGSSTDFFNQLKLVRDVVSQEFQQVVAPPDKENDGQNQTVAWRLLWESANDALNESLNEAPNEVLNENGTLDAFNEPREIVKQLADFKTGRQVTILSASARDKLDRLMPQLLNTIADSSKPDRALALMLEWLVSIVNRPQYLVLLLENPHILRHLVDLFLASRWVVETLTQIPVLLDELLYPENLFSLPDKAKLQSELRQRFLRLDPNDDEVAMETLRHFRVGHNFHAAAAELSGQLELMQVSDYLTFTAEVVLEQVLQLAWQSLTARHGYPQGLEDPSQPNFLIVGYGKLGGLEMGYSSDLDLVFIFDGDPQAMTDGERPLDTQTFYMRLGQKIIHQLNVRTVSGPLYEVDMRLRPSGNSGLLVSSFAAFSRYQLNDAWTWEHQALVRARPIAGHGVLATQFKKLREQVLGQVRDITKLKQDVIEMRQKMRKHLATSPQKRSNNDANAKFHLKQDHGGVVDIEFMVQYAVLAWAEKQPALSEWTDNIRILKSLKACGVITEQHANLLIEHYQTYRKMSHRLSLEQSQQSLVNAADIATERRDVRMLWDHFFYA